METLSTFKPDFETYKEIFMKLAYKSENSSDHQTQNGFTRRILLSEWVKYSVHLNWQDEVVRSSLVSLMFEIASTVEHSFSDYECMLGEQRQLISPAM